MLLYKRNHSTTSIEQTEYRMSDKPSMSSIMKAVSNMQSNMKLTQDYLENTTVTGSAGLETNVDDVSITLNGKFNCQTCRVSERFLAQQNAVAEQLIVNAINDAVSQVSVITRQQIEALSADLKTDES